MAASRMAAMRLLALETSTYRLSVALWQDGDLSEKAVHQPNGSSEWLLPAVGELLADAGCSLSDLDGIAFGAGPGSFTGLRLAVGCAQGLAVGLDLPVVGICTLEALALASGESRVFACLDARMNEVYSAAYTDGRETLAPRVSPPETVVLPDGNGWVGCGDGFAHYAERLPAFDRCCPDILPTAAAVARLAASRFENGEAVSADSAAPRYVREKVALTTAERLARGGLR